LVSKLSQQRPIVEKTAVSGRPKLLSKTKILGAAAQTLNERITFNAVARRLGISPQSIYRYYPNAATLQTDVARHFLERFDWREALDGSAENLRTALLTFGHGYRDWLRETHFDPQWLDREKVRGAITNEGMIQFQEEVTAEFKRRSGDWGISKEVATITSAVLFDFLYNSQTLYSVRTTDMSSASTEPDAASPESDIFEISLEAIADRMSRPPSETMSMTREAE